MGERPRQRDGDGKVTPRSKLKQGNGILGVSVDEF